MNDKYIIEIDNYKIKYKIMNEKEKLKKIIISNKLNELYENINEIEKDNMCSICLSNKNHQVQLYCGHNVCINCYVIAYDESRKCYGEIDFNDITLLKLC